MVDMPGGLMDLLFGFLHQIDGVLSMLAREREFAQMTDVEVQRSMRSMPGFAWRWRKALENDPMP
ncbi:hypothetical protein [Pleomorphomonas sp. JP5]|uniref:hypothetical protein n=1 Tax=Pleomorphomonas sp. JP5 TaxID=2942998 RepID=UPI002042E85E|nr:hypothetical protein [Pleomorphomonas sp. JP5]MCM5556317.1 hypothetical protein [Pleomorphomonas sp. JP5]